MFVELARLLDPTDTPRTLSFQRQNPACPRKTSRGPLCFQKTLEEGEHGLALPSFRTHSFGKCFQMSDSTPLACNIVAYFKKKNVIVCVCLWPVGALPKKARGFRFSWSQVERQLRVTCCGCWEPSPGALEEQDRRCSLSLVACRIKAYQKNWGDSIVSKVFAPGA